MKKKGDFEAAAVDQLPIRFTYSIDLTERACDLAIEIYETAAVVSLVCCLKALALSKLLQTKK